MDDKETRLVVSTALECAGLQCDVFASTPALLRGVKREDHRLIVADIDFEHTDCAALLAWRTNWLNPEVMVIAIGIDGPWAASRAFEAGVDDFVAKPVRGAELLARLNALTRTRRSQAAAPNFTLAGCRVDRASSTLVSASGQVALTGRELAVAQLLFDNPGQIVTRERLARDVWGTDKSLIGRTIEQHVYQLRRKLKRCVGEAVALRGVYGCGYRIEAAAGETTTASAPRAPVPPLSAASPSASTATMSPMAGAPPSASRPSPAFVPPERSGDQRFAMN